MAALAVRTQARAPPWALALPLVLELVLALALPMVLELVLVQVVLLLLSPPPPPPPRVHVLHPRGDATCTRTGSPGACNSWPRR